MSFEEAYNKHYRRLYGFAFNCGLSKCECEDLVHETFLRLWTEFIRGSEIHNLQAWLFKVLLNLLRTRKTSERRWNEKKKQIVGWESMNANFSEEFLLIEQRQIVEEELKLLPEIEKSLLILYNMGLKYEEIAQILNMKASSVGTTLGRTITKFRNSLKTKYNGMFE